MRSFAALIWLTAEVAVAAQAVQPLTITFGQSNVTIGGVSRSARVYVFSLVRERKGYYTSIQPSESNVVEASGSGLVSVPYVRQRSWRSLWFAVDLATGAYTGDSSETNLFDPVNMQREKDVSGLAEIYVYNAADERIGVFECSGPPTTCINAPVMWSLRDEAGKVLRQYQSTYVQGGSPQFVPPWAWLEDYVYRDGSLLGSERVPEEGGRRHFHLDHLGTPRLVTGDGGARIAEHDYYPFGVEITPLPQETNAGYDREEPMKFTGHLRDFNSGTSSDNANYNDFMHARNTVPQWGRFLSVDSNTGDPRWPQTWNRYSYVLNSPMNRIDPTGGCGEPLTFIGPILTCDMNFRLELDVVGKDPGFVQALRFIVNETTVQLTPFGFLPGGDDALWKAYQQKQFITANPDWRPSIVGSPIIIGSLTGPGPTESPGEIEWWTPSANEVRVTRWMSQDEAMAMKRSGTLQVGAEGKTYVTALGASKPGGTGPVRVDFNVPRGALNPAGRSDWYQIIFPARPPVTGIVVHQ